MIAWGGGAAAQKGAVTDSQNWSSPIFNGVRTGSLLPPILIAMVSASEAT